MNTQFSRANAALTYELPQLIRKLQDKEGLAEQDAKDLFQDTLRFLYICGTGNGGHVPSARIDLAWHYFILFTRDYRDFCDKFFGRFIDHQPRHQAETKAETLRQIKNTLAQARTVFGEGLSQNWRYRATDCEEPSADCTGGTTNCQDPPPCAQPARAAQTASQAAERT